MRKIPALLLILCLLLTGCSQEEATETKETDTTFSVYCTFNPLYALTLPLMEGAENVSIKCLAQPQDGDLPDYSLSDWDSVLLAMSDLLIAGGQGLEGFTTEGGSYAVFTVTEGMTPITDEAEDDDEETTNPHLYLSVQNAMDMTNAIAACLAETDSANSETYAANCETQAAALEALLTECEETMLATEEQSVGVLFDGLLYLTEEFGIDAPVVIERNPGESIEGTDYETAISQLSEGGCEIVLIEEQAPDNLVQDLEKDGFTVVKLDVLSCNNNYISAMRENIQRIAAAFGMK